jgi:hypothetical protein
MLLLLAAFLTAGANLAQLGIENKSSRRERHEVFVLLRQSSQLWITEGINSWVLLDPGMASHWYLRADSARSQGKVPKAILGQAEVLGAILVGPWHC